MRMSKGGPLLCLQATNRVAPAGEHDHLRSVVRIDVPEQDSSEEELSTSSDEEADVSAVPATFRLLPCWRDLSGLAWPQTCSSDCCCSLWACARPPRAGPGLSLGGLTACRDIN